MFSQVWPLVVNSTPPDASPLVRVWCLYGVGVPTPVHYAFSSGNLSEEPTVTMGDGDGQQPTESNGACARWRRGGGGGAENGTDVIVQTFAGASHDSILSDERVLSWVLGHVLVAD